MPSGKIPIVELFGPTLQGEGALCGQVSYFIRTGACQYRCSWCDSLHAVLPAEIKKNATYMAPDEIVDAISPDEHLDRQRTWVTLTGGDPLIWDLTEVVNGLYLRGFRIAVETQAVRWQDWLEHCDLVTASPKPPSSGMAEKFSPEVLRKYAVRLGDRLVVKVVVFDDADLDWAGKLHRWMPKVKFYLSSGTLQDGNVTDNVLASYRRLVAQVLERPEWRDVTVLPQVHVLLWGRELGR